MRNQFLTEQIPRTCIHGETQMGWSLLCDSTVDWVNPKTTSSSLDREMTALVTGFGWLLCWITPVLNVLKPVLLDFQKTHKGVLQYHCIHRCSSKFRKTLSSEEDVAFGFSTHLTGESPQWPTHLSLPMDCWIVHDESLSSQSSRWLGQMYRIVTEIREMRIDSTEFMTSLIFNFSCMTCDSSTAFSVMQ